MLSNTKKISNSCDFYESDFLCFLIAITITIITTNSKTNIKIPIPISIYNDELDELGVYEPLVDTVPAHLNILHPLILVV